MDDKSNSALSNAKRRALQKQYIDAAKDLILAGERDKAYLLIIRVLRMNQNNREAIWMYANLVGDNKQAAKGLRRLLWLEPDHVKARQMLERVESAVEEAAAEEVAAAEKTSVAEEVTAAEESAVAEEAVVAEEVGEETQKLSAYSAPEAAVAEEAVVAEQAPVVEEVTAAEESAVAEESAIAEEVGEETQKLSAYSVEEAPVETPALERDELGQQSLPQRHELLETPVEPENVIPVASVVETNAREPLETPVEPENVAPVASVVETNFGEALETPAEPENAAPAADIVETNAREPLETPAEPENAAPDADNVETNFDEPLETPVEPENVAPVAGVSVTNPPDVAVIAQYFTPAPPPAPVEVRERNPLIFVVGLVAGLFLAAFGLAYLLNGKILSGIVLILGGWLVWLPLALSLIHQLGTTGIFVAVTVHLVLAFIFAYNGAARKGIRYH